MDIVRRGSSAHLHLSLDLGMGANYFFRGDTLLGAAIHCGLIIATKLLLQYSADPNGTWGYPIRRAIWNESPVILEILSAAGADLNRHYFGYTCIISDTLKSGSFEIFHKLISLGAKVPSDWEEQLGPRAKDIAKKTAFLRDFT